MPKSVKGGQSVYPVDKSSKGKGTMPTVGQPPKVSTVEAFKKGKK